MKNLMRFIDRDLYLIRGFMHPADALAFSMIMSFQDASNWAGGLAEIGVYYGRSLSLMAVGAKAQASKVLGMDLFDIDGQQDYVRKVLKDRGLEAAVTLLPGSSLDLHPEDVLAACGNVRLFSIDGGHELEHINSDAELATASLSPQGVIAFDDFMNPQYPDLSRGIISFLESNSARIVPFAITKAKLYACTPATYEAFRGMMEQAQPWAGVVTDRFRFMDRDIVFLDQKILSRAVYQKLAEFGLGGLGARLAPSYRRKASRQ